MSPQTLRDYRTRLARFYKWTDEDIDKLPMYKANDYINEAFKKESEALAL